MIYLGNFCEKIGIQFGSKSDFRIPRATKSQDKLRRVLPSDMAEHRGKWICSADGKRAWLIFVHRQTGTPLLVGEQISDGIEALPMNRSDILDVVLRDIPLLNDRCFRISNFHHKLCVDSDLGKIGFRIFPDETEPIIFDKCNLTNVEIPDGSSTIRCNRTIAECEIQLDVLKLKVGDAEIIQPRIGIRIHGFYKDGVPVYKTKPEEIFDDDMRF